LVEGIFFAKLICDNGTGAVEIDARTSDAIALAVRFKCPVYTYEFILSSAGIILEEGALGEKAIDELAIETAPESSKDDLKLLTETELKNMLETALDNEDYERASKIRDELSNRGKA
jgi:hypothetical protein